LAASENDKQFLLLIIFFLYYEIYVAFKLSKNRRGCSKSPEKKAEPNAYEISAKGSVFWYNQIDEKRKIPDILSHKCEKYATEI